MLSDAYDRVGKQHDSTLSECVDLDFQLTSSFGDSGSPSSSEDSEPSSARRALPSELRDIIMSYMPRDSWGTGNFRLRCVYPLRRIHKLCVHQASIKKIRQAYDYPTVDLEIYAFAIRPINSFVLEFISKLETLAGLGRRIKRFELSLKTDRQTFLPLMEAAGRCFWYPKVLAVEASEALEDDDKIDFEDDDTITMITDALKANVPHTDLTTPKDVTLTGPLLLSFKGAGLLHCVTHLTLTASTSTFYLPQAITAGMPALRDLNLYGLNYSYGQPRINLGLISTLRIPSLSFLEYCRSSDDVRYLGIRAYEPDFQDPEEIEELLSRISTTFPLVKELETVSLANTRL